MGQKSMTQTLYSTGSGMATHFSAGTREMQPLHLSPRPRQPNHVRAYQFAAKGTEEQDRFQDALLRYSSKGDSLNVDSYLLDRPTSVNMPVQFDMGSSLQVASTRGHSELAQLLIHRGADVNRSNYAKQTSLHSACESNRASIVYELLAAGADADMRDAMKQTPLHRAAFTGSTDALLALLDYGANLKLRDEGKLLPIHKAASMGRSEAIALLLERDPISVNSEAADSWTPLHLAAHGGHAVACETLLLRGADPSAVDSERMTPLHRAATSGREASCQVLLRAGADPQAADQSRATPLHVACEMGFVLPARALLEAGAPVDVIDGMRRTPLHVAAENGHAELCDTLLQFGADPNAGDMSKGVPSPLQVARRQRNLGLVALFESYAPAGQG